jgi:hypothetical protein
LSVGQLQRNNSTAAAETELKNKQYLKHLQNKKISAAGAPEAVYTRWLCL